MPKCIVKGCLHHAGKKNSTPGVTLHRFPKDFTTIKKWLVQTNQDFGDLELFAQGIFHGKMGVPHICSAHFASECYTIVESQKVLLEGAIPTIFPERDKSSNRMETANTPVFQSLYLPISLWTNNLSVVSNIAPCGVNQLINPGFIINQTNNILTNNIVTNELGVNVSTSAAEYKPKERPNECGNAPTSFGKCLNSSFDLPDAMLHQQTNSDTKNVPTLLDLSTKKKDKAVQWPEYENMDEAVWKVMHDHFYKVSHDNEYESLNRYSPMTEDESGSDFEDTHLENELFSMLQYVVSIFTINKNKDLKTARILNQALDIVSLITGEEWVIVNKNSIHKGVHQLTGEFPVKCDNVAVFFTMDEWSYIDQHKEDYAEFVTDNVPMNRTWKAPEHWDSDPMTDDDDDDDEAIDNSLPKASSSDWEPDIDMESDDRRCDRGQVAHKCEESFPDTIALEAHKLTHMEKCDQCEESFPNTKALEAHKLTHMEKCDECEEYFPDTEALEAHKLTHMEKCDPMTDDDDDDDDGAIDISLRKASSSDWEPDFDMESDDSRCDRSQVAHKCDECEESFPNTKALEAHKLTHMEKCDQCEEYFPDTEALDAHKITHVEKCEDCEELFGSKAEFIKHWAENHADKRYPCSICGVQYDYKSQFIIHQRAHTGEKPFHCDDCGAKFGFKSSLLVHQRRHTDGKTFKCSKCKRLFDKRCELVRHEKVHAKKKKYKCQKCKKTFVRKGDLEKHKWDHDD